MQSRRNMLLVGRREIWLVSAWGHRKSGWNLEKMIKSSGGKLSVLIIFLKFSECILSFFSAPMSPWYLGIMLLHPTSKGRIKNGHLPKTRSEPETHVSKLSYPSTWMGNFCTCAYPCISCPQPLHSGTLPNFCLQTLFICLLSRF